MAKQRKRPYRKAKRAESEEETRRRITEAAVELHGTVGPAGTKLTELAKRAGVSRMTVYNHFPTEVDLFVACSTHWGSQNPFPELAAWRAHTDPEARLRLALTELYHWYEQKQGMVENVLRDRPLLPSLEPIVAGWWDAYMDRAVDELSEGWRRAPEADGPITASLRLAVDFHTWRTLTQSGLTTEAAADLAARLVTGVRAPRV